MRKSLQISTVIQIHSKIFFFEAGLDRNDVEVRGYIERGGITTLLDMHILNETSRYHVAGWIIEELFKSKKIDKLTRDFLQKRLEKIWKRSVLYQ